jgi:Bifunctional DNA primase/polymerase, N-terminal
VSMRDAAAAYAAAGWPLVPLHVGAKRPHLKTGTDHAEAATCDLEQVGAWWGRWPDAGIGIVCAAGGFVVLDVDGPAGMESFRAHDGPWPLSCCSISGRESGGYHVWYRVPPGVEVPRGRIVGSGLELKAAGNLVVAPPSLHKSGRRYAWDVPPGFMADGRYPVEPQVPAAWMLEGSTRAPADVPIVTVPLDGATGTPYGVKVLREELDRLASAPEGECNNTLFRVAVRLAELARAGHLDGDDVRWRVELAAEHAYRGTDPRGREATIDSAFRKATVA